MSPIGISLIALVIIFGGTLLGMFLRTIVNGQHLTADSRDVMKLGTSTIATLAALILGLLTSSAYGTFETINNTVKQAASKIILLDRTMAKYGPETKEARDILRHGVISSVQRIWPAEKNEIAVEKVGQSQGEREGLEKKLQQLSPLNDDQRRLQSRALEILGEIEEILRPLMTHIGQISFPMPLLVLLVCWLTIIFCNFGLITSRNTTVVAVLFVCAFSVASTLFVILELAQPFGGVIQISSAPMLKALEHLGQ
jgi:hypothetical protein